MPNGEEASGINYIVIDEESMAVFPSDTRRAAELLTAFLDGITVGRMTVDSSDDNDAAGDAPRPKSARSLRERIEASIASDRSPLRGPKCTLIARDVSRIRESNDERDVVLVWGPNAAATLRQIFPS
jgi:hypothetical protein